MQTQRVDDIEVQDAFIAGMIYALSSMAIALWRHREAKVGDGSWMDIQHAGSQWQGCTISGTIPLSLGLRPTCGRATQF